MSATPSSRRGTTLTAVWLCAWLLVLPSCDASNDARDDPSGGLDATTFDVSLVDASFEERNSGVPPPRDGALPRPADAHWDAVLRDGTPPPDPTPIDAAACGREPYLPKRFEPPCDQPAARDACTDGWCTIEAGCFIMGSPWCEWGRAKTSTDPVQITLTRSFQIAQFELTQREWTDLGLPNPSGSMADGTGDCIGDACPLGNVTLFEAMEFANLYSIAKGKSPCYVLSQCSGELGEGMVCDAIRNAGASIYECDGYRLPTGPEWEYAARAGTKTATYAGDFPRHEPDFNCYAEPVLEDIAWYCANAGSFTHQVGEKRPNRWGLYDMIGNAGEWVTSRAPLAPGYGEGPYTDYDSVLDIAGFLDPANPILMQYRSGGWNIWPSFHRAGRTSSVNPTGRGPGIGFRLVRSVGPMAATTR